MDCGESIYMWIGRSVSDQFLQQVFDVKSFNELPDHSVSLVFATNHHFELKFLIFIQFLERFT